MQVAFKLLVPCLLLTKVASVTAQQGGLQLLSVPLLAAVQVCYAPKAISAYITRVASVLYHNFRACTACLIALLC